MDARSAPVGAIEVGGSHVTALLVDVDDRGPWPGARRERRQLDPHSARDILLGAIIDAAHSAGIARAKRCGVAVPGPFDHAAGIARYADVGKFEALAGVDVGSALRTAIGIPAFTFVNDAAAFLLGEAAAGSAAGHDRAAALTLGTGVGSAFLASGRIVDAGPAVPPGGELHLMSVDGLPLEEAISARAILAAYRRLGALGDDAVEVRAIAARARAGDTVADMAFSGAIRRLGAIVAPFLLRFGASVLVVGGSMSDSWDLVHPALAGGIADVGGLEDLVIVRSADPEGAALLGAALAASAGNAAG